MSLFERKDLARVIAEAGDPLREEGQHGLKRSLGAFNLTMLGIGAIIGAGIFSLTGTAAANYAGPGIAYSFVLGGIICAFAGLCYAELAAMIPVAGSAYAYAYTTMGELVAWIIGWDLILEYAFGVVVVAIAWSGYLVQLFQSLDHLFPGSVFHLSDTALRLCAGPYEMANLSTGPAPGLVNIPAMLVCLGVVSILYKGVAEAAWVNNLIVIVKVAIVCVFVILGISLITADNLFVNPNATGLMALVPEREMIEGSWRYGWGTGGVLTGAGVVFFAYIGFDAVSTTAQEAKNPKRDLPIGILASLVVCTILYILVALVLTGTVPYKQLGVSAPIALGINKIVELRGWSVGTANTFTALIKLGALAGLTSVILVTTLAQTRIFYAMSKDGLLPWFDRTHPKYRTPHVATVLTGGLCALAAAVMPMHLVGELVSIGTLLAFVLVSLGVPILRRLSPEVPRPFKVPMPWVVGILGAATSLWVMSGLPGDTWIRLLLWLCVGFWTYTLYGVRHSVLRKERGDAGFSKLMFVVSTALTLATVGISAWYFA